MLMLILIFINYYVYVDIDGFICRFLTCLIKYYYFVIVILRLLGLNFYNEVICVINKKKSKFKLSRVI